MHNFFTIFILQQKFVNHENSDFCVLSYRKFKIIWICVSNKSCFVDIYITNFLSFSYPPHCSGVPCINKPFGNWHINTFSKYQYQFYQHTNQRRWWIILKMVLSIWELCSMDIFNHNSSLVIILVIPVILVIIQLFFTTISGIFLIK